MSHILIIEDELAIAEAVQQSLNKAGHTSDIEPFGEAALQRLLSARLSHELIILDIGLPDLNGFEVCRRVREHYSPEQLPILFLTAHTEEIDRVLGLELSGGDYLTKPFSLRELITRVRLLLGRRTVAAPTKHSTYGNFEWSEQEAWASYKRLKLALTVTEYKLLVLFLKHPKRVFSRQQLLDAVRGETHPSGERTIDTHIKSLRSKLREHSTQADIILTHRGLGYSSV